MEHMSDVGTVFTVILIILLSIAGIFLYFLPAIIAYKRKHSSKIAILLVNFLFGFTGIGWILALIWSCSGTGFHQVINIHQQMNPQNSAPSTPSSSISSPPPV